MNSLHPFSRLVALLIVCLLLVSFGGLPGGLLLAHAQGNPFTAGQITEYPLPQGHNPFGSIAKGPDGDLWFLEYPENMVGK